MTRRPLRPRRRSVGLGWRWGAAAAAAVAVVAVVVGVFLEHVPKGFRPAPVALGETAPTFVLESSGGERVDLADHVGRNAILLVFHAGYQCTACRAQLGKLRREIGRIRGLGTEVFAISDDRILDAKLIAAELGHEITILSDSSRWVGRRYGMRDSAGRGALTGYVVIDSAGIVRARRLDPLFGEHGDEILTILEAAARPKADDDCVVSSHACRLAQIPR
jgi:peroxiredoxin